MRRADRSRGAICVSSSERARILEIVDWCGRCASWNSRLAHWHSSCCVILTCENLMHSCRFCRFVRLPMGCERRFFLAAEGDGGVGVGVGVRAAPAAEADEPATGAGADDASAADAGRLSMAGDDEEGKMAECRESV